MTISRRDFLISTAFLAGSAFTTSASSGVPAAAPNLEQVDPQRLDTLVEQSVTSLATPGISLTIWRNGKEIYSRHAGLANLETRTRIVETSVFRIGSLTKQFAAALILKLQAAGKLSLTDPAHKYLPFLDKDEPFTILELLNHTAGVRDGNYDTSNLQLHSQIEQAQRMAHQVPFFDFRPGTAWLYSNANYSSRPTPSRPMLHACSRSWRHGVAPTQFVAPASWGWCPESANCMIAPESPFRAIAGCGWIRPNGVHIHSGERETCCGTS